MKSSSESIPTLLLLVCGEGSVTGFAEDSKVAAAEAIRLLVRVSSLSSYDIASAAFLFLDWEEMVTVNGSLARQSRRGPRHTRLPKKSDLGVDDPQKQATSQEWRVVVSVCDLMIKVRNVEGFAETFSRCLVKEGIGVVNQRRDGVNK